MEWAPIVGGIQSLGGWLGASATSLALFMAALPSDCRGSIIHVAATCSGTRPLYFPTAGFAPLEICWGWFGSGFIVGFWLGVAFLLCLLLFFRVISLNRGQRQQDPVPAVPLYQDTPDRHAAWDDAQYEFFQHILAGGPGLLREIAASSNRHPTQVISNVLLPEVIVPTNNSNSSSNSNSMNPSTHPSSGAQIRPSSIYHA